MTDPEKRPEGVSPSDSEYQPHEIPIINGSPWRNRSEFDRQLQAATLESLRLQEQGELFRWNWVNIFGDEISIVLENFPNDENIGPHALINMAQGEKEDGMELNTVGVRFHFDLKPLKGNKIFDVGDDDQITTFIGICARALEAGIPPDAIIDAAAFSSPSPNDYLSGQARRRDFHTLKLRDFSRQLSERQFL